MRYDFEKYKDKLDELKNYLTEAEAISPDVEVKLVLPGQEDADPEIKVPYLLVCYYVDESRCYTRKIELFEYYLQDDINELINKITAMIKEFAMEVDQTEFGGG